MQLVDKNGNVVDFQEIVQNVKSEAALAAERGDLYAWNAATAAIDTTDCLILLRNDDPGKLLYIETIWLGLDVPGVMHIHLPVSFTATDGTAITAVPMSTVSSSTPLYTARADNTDVETFAAARTIMSVRTNEVTTDIHGTEPVQFGGKLVLGYGKTVAVDIIGEPGAYTATIIGYYK